METHYIDLFEYTYRSNLTTIELLEKYGKEVPHQTLIAFSHVINAHHLWNHRIEQTSPTFKVWDIHSIESFREINQNLLDQSIKIINSKDLEETISYTNSQGENFKNQIKEILFHVVNHSTYHRGQVMYQMRDAGLGAVSTDYIFYKRY